MDKSFTLMSLQGKEDASLPACALLAEFVVMQYPWHPQSDKHAVLYTARHCSAPRQRCRNMYLFLVPSWVKTHCLECGLVISVCAVADDDLMVMLPGSDRPSISAEGVDSFIFSRRHIPSLGLTLTEGRLVSLPAQSQNFTRFGSVGGSPRETGLTCLPAKSQNLMVPLPTAGAPKGY